MIPTNLLGLLLFVLAVAPGWVWVRVAERREVQPERSALLEAAELVITGVVFTMAATVAVWTVAWQAGWLPDLRLALVADDPYWQREPYRTAVAGVVIFLLSMMAAYLAARVVYRDKEPSLRPAGSVWRDVLAEGGEGRPIYVSADLIDGRYVEGFLHSYSIDPGGDEGDLSLQAPFLRLQDGSRRRAPADRLILQRDQIASVWVKYMWDRSKRS